jgi:hypothetical protein
MKNDLGLLRNGLSEPPSASKQFLQSGPHTLDLNEMPDVAQGCHLTNGKRVP